MADSLPTPVSPTDWIRIFASRFACRRPNARAEDVLAVAIEQFKRCPSIAPEVAVEQVFTETGEVPPPVR